MESLIKNKLLCPSMMCADFDNLKKEVVQLDDAGVDIFHLDVMDGRYVPNFGLSPQDISSIRRNTTKPIDVHLMVMEPSNHIEMYSQLGANIIYIHADADLHPSRTLDKIKSYGIETGLAINPGVSIESIFELLPLIDNILIMTVNPGFAGQKYVSYVDEKIEKIVKMKENFDFKVFVDGAVSPDVVNNLSNIGVDGFVLGTSALFGKDKPYSEIIKSLKQ